MPYNFEIFGEIEFHLIFTSLSLYRGFLTSKFVEESDHEEMDFLLEHMKIIDGMEIRLMDLKRSFEDGKEN